MNNELPAPRQVMRKVGTHVPAWLEHYQAYQQFPRKEFFKSRIFFYPAAHLDCHPVHVFGKTHAIHCFVYVDNGVRRQEVREAFTNADNPHHPSGYSLLSLMELNHKDVFPDEWERHFPSYPDTTDSPFAFWAVMERVQEKDDHLGPKRIALLYLGYEAVMTFDALFCQKGDRQPYATLVHNHYGWDSFDGRNPVWESISHLRRGLPRWLLIADYTHPWEYYKCVSRASYGGNCARYLFMRDRFLDWRLPGIHDIDLSKR